MELRVVKETSHIVETFHWPEYASCGASSCGIFYDSKFGNNRALVIKDGLLKENVILTGLNNSKAKRLTFDDGKMVAIQLNQNLVISVAAIANSEYRFTKIFEIPLKFDAEDWCYNMEAMFLWNRDGKLMKINLKGITDIRFEKRFVQYFEMPEYETKMIQKSKAVFVGNNQLYILSNILDVVKFNESKEKFENLYIPYIPVKENTKYSAIIDSNLLYVYRYRNGITKLQPKLYVLELKSSFGAMHKIKFSGCNPCSVVQMDVRANQLTLVGNCFFPQCEKCSHLYNFQLEGNAWKSDEQSSLTSRCLATFRRMLPFQAKEKTNKPDVFKQTISNWTTSSK